MAQEGAFRRDDWNVRIKTWAEMTATRDHFILSATVTAWDGEEVFHDVAWDHRIARNGM